MGVELAKEHPEELLESGPAGGVAYAGYLAEAIHERSIICADMGGTSFDASIVEDGKGLVTREYELEFELPIILPMLDIHSVGAGGGSIGWVDSGGSLRVGPRSAGSQPGPACYGNGGTEPTITDANLLLGRLEPTLGGKINLDRQAAEQAVSTVAQQLSLSAVETADAMIQISCEIMAQAVKKVIVDRGRDPRDFVLTSFGGAGPMHACFVARAMNIPKVIVPAAAGVASAFGATVMDVRQDVEQFMYSPVDDIDLARLNTAYAELEQTARDLLALDNVSAENVIINRTAQMRYVGQTYEIETPIPDGALTQDALVTIAETFHAVHKQEHGVSSDIFDPALVSLSVAATAPTAALPPYRSVATENVVAMKSSRSVYFSGEWLDCPIYNGQILQPGTELQGPTILEYLDSVAVLPPGAQATVDTQGNLIIQVGR